MTCNRIRAHLDDYLDGVVPVALHRALEAHALQCAACGAVVAGARELQEALGAYPMAGPTPGFFDRALASAQAHSTPASPTRAWTVGATSALAAGFAVLVISGVLLQRPQLEGGALHEAPHTAGALTGVSMAVHETRTVNLIFSASSDLQGVSLTVDLPAGIELAGYAGVERVRWTTRLQAGKNVLPLELVALGGVGGELVARLRHQGEEKIFTVDVAVISG